MTLLAAAALLLACDEPTMPNDAGADAAVDATLPDAGPNTCGRPEGADPRVGEGQPAPDMRCTRVPFPLHAPRDVTVDGDEVLVTELSGRFSYELHQQHREIGVLEVLPR